MKKKPRFLVVDDDDANNIICEFTIRRLTKEADIKMFLNPEEGIAYIKEEYTSTGEAMPTVLFLDINMPTMSGWEFLDIFMQFDDFVKHQFTIYILSSSIQNFTEEAKIYTFIQGFLSKPLNLNKLEKVMMDLQELQLS